MDCQLVSGGEDGCGCQDRFGEGSSSIYFSLFFMLISYNQNIIDQDKPTPSTGIPKCHRKNLPAGRTHTGLGCRHGALRPTRRPLCGNGPTNRAGGHCQLTD